MRFSAVCLLVLALLVSPVLMGCGGGEGGGKKADPSASVPKGMTTPPPGTPAARAAKK